MHFPPNLQLNQVKPKHDAGTRLPRSGALDIYMQTKPKDLKDSIFIGLGQDQPSKFEEDAVEWTSEIPGAPTWRNSPAPG